MRESLFDLTGETAVVIGGSTGIGYALSIGLADAGADVLASSRRSEQVQRVAGAIEQGGRRTLRCTFDVRRRETLIALHDAVLSEFGKVDILINCAGAIKRGPALVFPAEES